jgi:hypothetical protein
MSGPRPHEQRDAGDEAHAVEPTGKPRKRRRSSTAQTIGGVLFGFEQQVWRTAPPAQELVHHARPDAPLPAGDGTMITIQLPPTVIEEAP